MSNPLRLFSEQEEVGASGVHLAMGVFTLLLSTQIFWPLEVFCFQQKTILKGSNHFPLLRALHSQLNWPVSGSAVGQALFPEWNKTALALSA